jgi:methionine salvage enolase-phosphatase E1
MKVLLEQKTSEIDTMQQWLFGDEYLKQDAVLQEKMKDFRVRVNVEQDRETQGMAEAAEQSIKTLQNLLEQKNESLRQKEQHLEKLRQTMEEQR